MEKTIFPLEKVKILYRIDSRCRRYPRLLQHVGDDVATIQLTRARDMDTDEQSISTVTSGEQQQPDTWASFRPSSSCLWRAGGTPRGRGPLRPSQA